MLVGQSANDAIKRVVTAVPIAAPEHPLRIEVTTVVCHPPVNLELHRVSVVEVRRD